MSTSSSLDKLSIIKAYEQILRNEGILYNLILPLIIGILPVSDSRIYNLVFKVLKKCEKSFQNSPLLASREFNFQQSLYSLIRVNDALQKATEYDVFRSKKKIMALLKINMIEKYNSNRNTNQSFEMQNYSSAQNNKENLNKSTDSSHNNSFNPQRHFISS